jgi:hypothetical protein
VSDELARSRPGGDALRRQDRNAAWARDSAFEAWRHAYLIDGVAINGVSGGPVLFLHQTRGVQLVGSISAYIAKRATGEALPGLAVAQDISHVHAVAADIKSYDELRRKEAEEARQATRADPTNR